MAEHPIIHAPADLAPFVGPAVPEARARRAGARGGLVLVVAGTR